MLEGHLLMSEKERKCKEAFKVIRAGAWTHTEAAEHLGISSRECNRSARETSCSSSNGPWRDYYGPCTELCVRGGHI